VAKKFNVRVYGILIEGESLLVSDEYIKGHYVTKFVGGGLEYGEGTKDCLIREFKEELNLDIEVLSHFYTTDFFVSSAFNATSQVISIYYRVKAISPLNFNVSVTPFNFSKKEGAQSLRFVKISELTDADFTLIIDKKVGEMLRKG
jgi:8-oxo-dGTP diphosphatase